MIEEDNTEEKKQLKRERYKLLNQLQEYFEVPMIILGFVWLLLLLIELLDELNPALHMAGQIIWIIFILDFLIKFIVAPKKIPFLKKNVLTAISLIVPALRIFRIARAFRALSTLRAARGLRLVRIISSINRGMRSLGRTMEKRGLGYVLILTVGVLFIGAAGMYAFERDESNGLETYGSAVWWTAMILVTYGSGYWPKSPEGQILCFFLAVYGFAVFGYLTATLATFFVGQEATEKDSEIAGAKHIKELKEEIAKLRDDIKKDKPR